MLHIAGHAILNQRQASILLYIIKNSGIPGDIVEEVAEIKRVLSESIKPEPKTGDAGEPVSSQQPAQ